MTATDLTTPAGIPGSGRQPAPGASAGAMTTQKCAPGTGPKRESAPEEPPGTRKVRGGARDVPPKTPQKPGVGVQTSIYKKNDSSDLLADRAARVRATARRSRADATLANYARAWRTFAAWCAHEGRVALDPDPERAAASVAEYLRDRADAGMKWPTCGLDLAGIGFRYADAGLPRPSQHPGLKRFVEGLRREVGRATASKAPVTDAELKAMLATLPPTIRGVRDRALLLVGFVGAFRRSELVGLDVDDVAEDPQGLVITVRRSKTDQEAVGQLKAIPYSADAAACPMRALRAWLEAAEIAEGPLFRAIDRHGNVKLSRTDGLTVARVVKRAALAEGLEPARVSGHSLRAGFVTAAAQRGASERAIANQTGHRSMLMLRSYIRRANAFEENAATAVAL